MSSLLTRLAQWATELDAARVPDEVLRLALLQQLALAGAAHAAVALPLKDALVPSGLSRGSAPVMGAQSALPRRDAARVNAALVGALDFDELIFLGPGSPSGAAVGWAHAKGHTVRELLVAQVAANELVARLHASALTGPYFDGGLGPAHALAAAVVGARLNALDAQTTAHALSLALSTAAPVPRPARLGAPEGLGAAVGAATLAGLDAVDLARRGAKGPLDLLDHVGGLFYTLGCPLPLRAAFTGLGEQWLTRTLTVRALPVAAHTLTAVEAVLEILTRHVKAADKRLRTDQVERVEIHLPAPALALDTLAEQHPGLDVAAAGASYSRAVALALAGHGLGAEQRDPRWIRQHRAVLDDLVGRVRVEHSWALTTRWVHGMYTVAGPLFDEVGRRRLLEATQSWRRLLPPLGLPRSMRELTELAQARPDRLLVRSPGVAELGTLDLSAFHQPWPVEVKLYTTRGGWWPERREAIEHGPQQGESGVRAAALAKLRAGTGWEADTVEALAGTAWDSDAERWVERLAARGPQTSAQG